MVSTRKVSLLDTLLSLINFLLRDISIAVISPDGVGSQLGALTVRPVTQGDVGNSPSLVVLGDFHGFSILDVALCFQL